MDIVCHQVSGSKLRCPPLLCFGLPLPCNLSSCPTRSCCLHCYTALSPSLRATARSRRSPRRPWAVDHARAPAALCNGSSRRSCPFCGKASVPLLHFGGHHSGDFAHAVAARAACIHAGMWSARCPATLPPTSRAAPVHRPAARSSEVIRRSSSSSGWPRTRTASPARPWRRFCGGTRGATCGSAVTGRRRSCSSSRWRTVRELLSFPSARRPVIGPTSLRCEWWRPSA